VGSNDCLTSDEARCGVYITVVPRASHKVYNEVERGKLKGSKSEGPTSNRPCSVVRENGVVLNGNKECVVLWGEA